MSAGRRIGEMRVEILLDGFCWTRTFPFDVVPTAESADVRVDTFIGVVGVTVVPATAWLLVAGMTRSGPSKTGPRDESLRLGMSARTRSPCAIGPSLVVEILLLKTDEVDVSGIRKFHIAAVGCAGAQLLVEFDDPPVHAVLVGREEGVHVRSVCFELAAPVLEDEYDRAYSKAVRDDPVPLSSYSASGGPFAAGNELETPKARCRVFGDDDVKASKDFIKVESSSREDVIPFAVGDGWSLASENVRLVFSEISLYEGDALLRGAQRRANGRDTSLALLRPRHGSKPLLKVSCRL